MSAIDELSRKFVSGNDVQVERASFTREEWQSVVDERDQLRDALSIAEGLAKQNKEMAEGFIQLRARVAELEAALQGMLDIVADSRGVAGYHLNGDTAEWDEFDEVDAAEKLLNQLEADNG